MRYPDGTATLYRLDPVGNRTGERKTLAAKVAALVVAAFAAVQPADAIVDLTGAFNRADWLLSRTDAADATRNVAFSYDLDGNLVSKQTAAATRTLRWDARNTLVAVYDVGVETGRKVLYTNPQTGIRVVYDPQGNYFRVEDPSARSEVDRYLDQSGQRLPQNVPLVGPRRTTQTGVPKDVRKALTHFKNSDPTPEGPP